VNSDQRAEGRLLDLPCVDLLFSLSIMFNRILVVLALLSCPMAYAADTPASEASVKQLLEVAQARKLVDTMMSQMDGMMKNAMQAATQGQSVSPEVQRIFDKTRADVAAVMKEEFTWEKLEPMYLRIYEESLNQTEVEGMITFYKTQAGRAVINKMPMIIQNSMSEVMQMMGPVVQRVERMQKEMVAQIQTEKAKKNG
jgi:uncharacterized protein